MHVTRPEFLQYATASAAEMGLGAADLARLEAALAAPNAPEVLWLQGGDCNGCTASFLDGVALTPEGFAAGTLCHALDLTDRPEEPMSGAAYAAARDVYRRGGYVLVVEGAVPTAFHGATCWARTLDGDLVPLKEAVADLAGRAERVICAGNCAAWGGAAAAGSNPAGLRGVPEVTERATLNIAGCPPPAHAVAWALVQSLLGRMVPTDADGCPLHLAPGPVRCPRSRTGGPCPDGIDCDDTSAATTCPLVRWNDGMTWCTEANASCPGCPPIAGQDRAGAVKTSCR